MPTDPPWKNRNVLKYFDKLKGQCHEMNNFFEGLKNKISTFCICADGF